MLGRDNDVWIRIMASAPHTEPAKIKLERGGCPRALCVRSGQGWSSVSLWARTHQSVKRIVEVTGY